ncbi:MAG: GNAT family N-acetyltransferase [Bacillota bacterium]|nr:GNAT family N-acetyltransferase [Bacillota bacterium]
MVEHKWSFGLPKDGKRIREEVFTFEQGFAPEIDIDEKDASSWHIVLYIDGYPVSTGRVFEEDPETYHIGRVAVRKNFRGLKLGTYTVKFLMTKAKTLGAKRVILGAQLDKIPFYKTLGFKEDPTGEVFLDGGAPHMWMSKELKSKRRR